MTLRITLQPAFVLHTKAYSDTSLLVDLFTLSHGRVYALARGARGARSRYRGQLRPFVPLLATWSGKTELMNLSMVESNGLPYELKGDTLLSGIYLNEILVKLLHRYDPHPQLFMAYQHTLAALQHDKESEYLLRLFEKQLLTELGYGIQFDRDVDGHLIEPEEIYLFDPNRGFYTWNGFSVVKASFLGKNILAFQDNKMRTRDELNTAKQLMRMAIESLLGDKPPKSRELFVGLRKTIDSNL